MLVFFTSACSKSKVLHFDSSSTSPSPQLIEKLAVANNTACALFTNGKIKCWGNNTLGQLGLGDANPRGDQAGEMGENLPTVDVGYSGHEIVDLQGGQFSFCVLFDDGKLKCWGSNNFGQLGLGDTQNRGDNANEMGDNLPFVDVGSGRSVKELAIGAYTTCVILDNDSVKCWGWNLDGQLGLGNTATRGDNANEMGDNLSAIDVGTGRKVKHVYPYYRKTCAILDNDSVKCWGYNSNGQLGIGDTASRGDGANEMGDNLPTVDLGTGRHAVKIAMGTSHICALLDNSTVKCWGDNQFGRLGLGDTAHRGDSAGEMGDALPALDFGAGLTVSQLGLGAYSCVLLSNNSVKCWGDNSTGDLGLGDINNRGDSAGEMGSALTPVDLGTSDEIRQLAVGVHFTCVLFKTDKVKCYGQNPGGALGLGDTVNRGSSPTDMGSNLPYVDLGLEGLFD